MIDPLRSQGTASLASPAPGIPVQGAPQTHTLPTTSLVPDRVEIQGVGATLPFTNSSPAPAVSSLSQNSVTATCLTSLDTACALKDAGTTSFTPPGLRAVAADVPSTLLCEATPAALVVAPAPPPAPSLARDLGPGFPSIPQAPHTWARRLHDVVAARLPGPYNAASGLVLSLITKATEKGVGLNASQLVELEESMYRMMVPSRDGYVGGSPPIFEALAQGQAAYVHLSDDPEGADHLTRLYSSLPSDQLLAMGVGADRYTPVRQALLDRIQRGDFPVFVDTDGNYAHSSGTESVAAESMASIARRQNTLGAVSADPSSYYRWLVTRVDSDFRRTDPWLFSANPPLHARIVDIKQALSPTWITQSNQDAGGSLPTLGAVEHAYQGVMQSAGGGKPPTLQTFADFADTSVALDRDLLFAVQTYWAKLMREVSPAQRESLLAPLAAAWVNLNLVPPSDPQFDLVSPPTAPNIELIDQHTGAFRFDRYDRAMAVSEVVDHTLNGLGIEQRGVFMSLLKQQIQARQPEIEERENRVRALLGASYDGLDVAGVLSGRLDGHDPSVKRGLEQLRNALQSGGVLSSVTPEHADLLRHMDMLDFVANLSLTYSDPVKKLAGQLDVGDAPLMVGDYWAPASLRTASGVSDPVGVTPVREVPVQSQVLGQPVPGQAPLPTSIVLEGGGGKGFAYIECLRQLKAALNAQQGQVAIDQYVGTSAGAITAGLFAAGYSEDDVAGFLNDLDFKKFYADYLWLAGGVDPQVRGFDRTGLFTTRQMYQTIENLLATKVGVQGRPVLFSDLPYGLKVVSTVINSDLSPELRHQLGIDKDGQVVFSKENTPNMDVAAAICASAAVPGFFAAPQVRIAQQTVDTQGNPHAQEYRMQLVDGGVVNDLPVTVGLNGGETQPCMVMMPSYAEAPGAHPGDPPVSLTTLNFDPANLAVIDRYNASRYQQFAPGVARTLAAAREGGSQRAVLALNLSKMDEQTKPLIQGRTPAASAQLRSLAAQQSLDVLSDADARTLVASTAPSGLARPEQLVVEGLLQGKDHVFEPSLLHGAAFHPPGVEASHVSDVLLATVAAGQVAAQTSQQRLFEQA